MKHRHQYENKYCGTCKATIKHEVKQAKFTCLRCGSEKTPVRVVIQRPEYAAAGE